MRIELATWAAEANGGSDRADLIGPRFARWSTSGFNFYLEALHNATVLKRSIRSIGIEILGSLPREGVFLTSKVSCRRVRVSPPCRSAHTHTSTERLQLGPAEVPAGSRCCPAATARRRRTRVWRPRWRYDMHAPLPVRTLRTRVCTITVWDARCRRWA